jgi:hypothetical protein
MKKFWTLKRFWFVLTALILIGVFVYFVLFSKKDGVLPKEFEELKKDKIPPLTAVISPENKSWHNQDFEVVIFDSDLGSGLIDFLPGKRGCRYLIVDLGNLQTIDDLRECGSAKIKIPVGKGKICSSSYSAENISLGKCKVSTKAIDKAGNESDWESRTFNIDLIEPEVDKININQNLEIEKEYLFKTMVSDNSKITGCWFYINGNYVDEQVNLLSITSESKDKYDIFLNYKFQEEGNYSIGFGCTDIAGNLGLGESINIKVAKNHPPKISSCNVDSIEGTRETEFHFTVEASDPDGDQLSFLWNFGDNKTSSEQNPVHFYETFGIFKPEISVSDNNEAETKCSTAWLTVIEN